MSFSLSRPTNFRKSLSLTLFLSHPTNVHAYCCVTCPKFHFLRIAYFGSAVLRTYVLRALLGLCSELTCQGGGNTLARCAGRWTSCRSQLILSRKSSNSFVIVIIVDGFGYLLVTPFSFLQSTWLFQIFRFALFIFSFSSTFYF